MRVATCFFLLLFAATSVFADTLTYNVTTDKSAYVVGETVNWQTHVTLSDVSGNPANFGIQAAGFDLAEDRLETLQAATVGAPFADYNFLIGAAGIPGGNGAGTLANVAIGQFGYLPDVVEVTPAAPGPTLLSQGSFTVTQLGTHTLTLSPDDSTFFTANTPGGFAGAPFTTAGSAASYNVTATAIPEPSSVLLSLICVGSALGFSWRRRSKAKAAEREAEESNEAAV